MKTLVIIPCYNEEENIRKVVADLRAHAPEVDLSLIHI